MSARSTVSRRVVRQVWPAPMSTQGVPPIRSSVQKEEAAQPAVVAGLGRQHPRLCLLGERACLICVGRGRAQVGHLRQIRVADRGAVPCLHCDCHCNPPLSCAYVPSPSFRPPGPNRNLSGAGPPPTSARVPPIQPGQPPTMAPAPQGQGERQVPTMASAPRQRPQLPHQAAVPVHGEAPGKVHQAVTVELQLHRRSAGVLHQQRLELGDAAVALALQREHHPQRRLRGPPPPLRPPRSRRASPPPRGCRAGRAPARRRRRPACARARSSSWGTPPSRCCRRSPRARRSPSARPCGCTCATAS